MKLIYSFIFIIFVTPTFASQVTNVSAGLWSNATIWDDNAIPTIDDTVLLSYDIVIDINATCMLLNTNGHNVTISTGVNFIVVGNNTPLEVDSTFTDTRDGQVYTFRHIGTQVWMTKNLNYAVDTSICYNNYPANCDIYGRLYSWADALIAVPAGWHLPSDVEWTTLTNNLGGAAVAGGVMKSTSSLWSNPNAGATNSSGFSGLPAGNRFSDGTFGDISYNGYWWSSTAYNSSYVYIRNLWYNDAAISRAVNLKTVSISVRCVRN